MYQITSKLSPKAIRTIKVGTVVVAAVAGATVAGYVLYRLGYLSYGTEVKELVEAVEQTAL